jgi:hypothetical protein
MLLAIAAAVIPELGFRTAWTAPANTPNQPCVCLSNLDARWIPCCQSSATWCAILGAISVYFFMVLWDNFQNGFSFLDQLGEPLHAVGY